MFIVILRITRKILFIFIMLKIFYANIVRKINLVTLSLKLSKFRSSAKNKHTYTIVLIEKKQNRLQKNRYSKINSK